MCEDAIDGERILGPEAISEELRETIGKHIGIPSSEPLWCFLDTSAVKKGHFGLVVGARGLYWQNDADIYEYTRLKRLSWDEIGDHTFALDPADNDIMVGTTSQIGI